MSKTWRCIDCDIITSTSDLREGKHPFRDEPVVGCPDCGCLEFEEVCDVDGCLNRASCGKPLKDGSYLRCCGDHYRSVE